MLSQPPANHGLPSRAPRPADGLDPATPLDTVTDPEIIAAVEPEVLRIRMGYASEKREVASFGRTHAPSWVRRSRPICGGATVPSSDPVPATAAGKTNPPFPRPG